MRVRKAYVIVVGISALFLVLFMQYYYYQNQHQVVEAKMESSLSESTKSVSDNIENCLQKHMVALNTAASFFGDLKDNNWEDQMSVLSTLAKEYSFDAIQICDTLGNAIDTDQNASDVSYSKYFLRAMEGDATVEFTKLEKNGGEYGVLFTIPILRTDVVIGVIRAVLNVNEITDLLTITAYRGLEEVYVIDKDSSILFNESQPVTNIQTLNNFMDTSTTEYSDLLKTIRVGKTFLKELDFRESAQYVSYCGLRSMNDWGILVTISESELNSAVSSGEDSNQMIRSIISIVLLIFLIMCLVFSCLTKENQKKQLEVLAYVDPITKSMNYNRMKQKLRLLLEGNQSANYACVYLSVDKCDYVKEFFGYESWEKTLLHISATIQGQIKVDEVYCRYDTDNYVLFLNYHNEEELSGRILMLDDKIRSFSHFQVENETYNLRVLCGIYCLNRNDKDIQNCLGHAQSAQKTIRDVKKRPFAYYSKEMQNRLADEHEMEEHMVEALKEREFLVYLQPKFDLQSGMPVGAEALVRWLHPKKGLLYPGSFIQLFEKNGFIKELDMYIIEQLCHRIKVWTSKGYTPVPLSVNLSILNLFDASFTTRLVEIVDRYGIPYNLIQLEVSEEAMTENMELVVDVIKQLKGYGFLVSMDDFGTGTTSVNMLYQIPIDELKLDRKFLLGAEKTERGQTIISSIINIAKSLDIKVVSEGVENNIQARLLRDMGCDMIQGFVFSDPLPIKEYEQYAYGPRSKQNCIW